MPSSAKVVIEGDIVKYEPSGVRSSPKTAAFDIADDVLIIDPIDESATVHLNEQCQVIGKIDTLFAKVLRQQEGSNDEWLKDMRTVNGVEWEEHRTMQYLLKVAARERGANVAQIIYVTSALAEVREKSKNTSTKLPFSWSRAALDDRYWSCAANQSQ